MADRILLEDGSLLIQEDDLFFFLLEATPGESVAPGTDTSPYRRTYLTDHRRTYLTDHRRNYRSP